MGYWGRELGGRETATIAVFVDKPTAAHAVDMHTHALTIHVRSLYTCAPFSPRRMEQLKAAEERAMVEDLMYVSILEKFATLGVDMLPRIDDYVHTETPSNLKVWC